MFEKGEINHVFQPVFSLKQEKAIGFEALMRHEFLSRPDILFKVARELGELYYLDTLSIEKAIETFKHESNGYLFLNVFPSTLLSPEFPDFLENIMGRFPIKPNQIVFEINETFIEENVWNTPFLKERIAVLRQLGFMIALDDVGVGVASIQKMVEIKPDIIKLDRYFSIDLSQSNTKQEILNFFVMFCENQESMLVLEGVEESVDFITALRLNVPFVQGYYTGKPLSYRHIEEQMEE